MANNEKNKKRNTAIILVLIFIIGVAAGFAYGRFAGGGNNPTTENPSSESTSQSVSQSTTAAPSTDAPTEDESTTKEQTTATTKKVETDYDLPMNINTALDALGEHYGNSFEINSTVEDGGLNYFSIYKDGEKYASVAVNLKTGAATETLSSNGSKTNFSLVK